MKIVVLDGYTLNPGDLSWDSLRQLGDVTVYDRSNKEDLIKNIGDAPYVFTNKSILDENTIKSCKNLKFIGVLATGYNIVDVDTAKKQNIFVCNVPSYSTESVVQHTFALLLNICNKVSLHNDSVLSGKWSSCIDFSYQVSPLMELKDKVFGILGFGQIGQKCAEVATALGMQVIYYSRTPKNFSDYASYVTLDELFAKSDIISLHCPITKHTKHLINKNNITKMKDGVIIINTARGDIINEQDLADALNCGKISAAGCDVVSAEPISTQNPLLKAKNIYITPHVAWAPYETRKRLLSLSVENLRKFLEGTPINSVY